MERKVLCVVAAWVLAGFAVGLSGCGGDEQAEQGDALVIYSPHSSAIQDEFARAFEPWYRERFGRPVRIEWPDVGGSSDVLRQIEDKYRRGIRDVDVVFGGGPIHARMKRSGLLQPCQLPEEVLQRLPETIAGEPLYDPDGFWYGAAISTFGLIYNEELLERRDLPAVTEWSDMGRPEFFGLVGVADPTRSGSVRKAYEIVLQAYGYDRGMEILTRMAANARTIGQSGSDIPTDCAQGFVAVGVCIDFYAWRQTMSPGGERIGFTVPRGMTVINTDPISVLRDCPHPETAEAFVRFALSPQGQRLWSYRKGTPGGPTEETLGRLAVLPEVYEDGKPYLVPGLENPLDTPPNTFYGQAKENARIEILPAFLKALMTSNKQMLSEAWEAVIAAGLPEDLVEELTRPLITEEEMLRLAREVWAPVVVPEDATEAERRELEAERDRRRKLRSDNELAWSQGFRKRYREVREEARRRAED